MSVRTIIFVSIPKQCPVGCDCDNRTPEQKRICDEIIKEFNSGVKPKRKNHKGSAIYLPPRKH